MDDDGPADLLQRVAVGVGAQVAWRGRRARRRGGASPERRGAASAGGTVCGAARASTRRARPRGRGARRCRARAGRAGRRRATAARRSCAEVSRRRATRCPRPDLPSAAMSQLPGPAEFAEHDGDHHHRDVSGGALRAATFGAMDGLVTNIALVAGVGGGGADRHVIILTGMAGLVAGAFSMALGEFASVQTQNDAVAGEVAVERAELARHPKAEEAELVDMYREMGLTAGDGRGRGAGGARRPGAGAQGARHPGARRRPRRAAVALDGRDLVVRVLRGRRDRAADLPFLLGGASLAVGLLVGAVGLFVGRRGDVAVHRQAVVVRRRRASCCSARSRRGRRTWWAH